jgi:hypothetical protein
MLLPLLIYAADLKDGQKLKITGVIHLLDNEPFSRFAVRSGNNAFYLPKEDKKKYIKFLNKKVVVEGTLKIDKLVTADYKHTVIEYNIEKIKSIKIAN